MATWQQPGLMAAAEIDGHGDSCGPIVMEDYLHILRGESLSVANTDAIRAQMIAAGLMNTPAYRGMTITSLAVGFETYYNVKPVKVVAYNASLDLNTFHTDLVAAMEAQQLVIMETANASALPDAQPGVQYHFILIGGIDSTLGYWTCNGDTETALHSSGVTSPVWYTWSNLVSSQPVGYIILPKVSALAMSIIVETDAQGYVTGAHDAADPKLHIGAGFAFRAQSDGLLGDDITLGETYLASTAYCILSQRTSMTWTQAGGVQRYDGADLAGLIAGLHAGQGGSATDNTAAIAALRAAQKTLEEGMAALDPAIGSVK